MTQTADDIHHYGADLDAHANRLTELVSELKTEIERAREHCKVAMSEIGDLNDDLWRVISEYEDQSLRQWEKLLENAPNLRMFAQ